MRERTSGSHTGWTLVLRKLARLYKRLHLLLRAIGVGFLLWNRLRGVKGARDLEKRQGGTRESRESWCSYVLEVSWCWRSCWRWRVAVICGKCSEYWTPTSIQVSVICSSIFSFFDIFYNINLIFKCVFNIDCDGPTFITLFSYLTHINTLEAIKEVSNDRRYHRGNLLYYRINLLVLLRVWQWLRGFTRGQKLVYCHVEVGRRDTDYIQRTIYDIYYTRRHCVQGFYGHTLAPKDSTAIFWHPRISAGGLKLSVTQKLRWAFVLRFSHWELHKASRSNFLFLWRMIVIHRVC